jgi:hypothetical protein
MEHIICPGCSAEQPKVNANCGQCGAKLNSFLPKKTIIFGICGAVLGIFLISFASAYLANYWMYRLTESIEQERRDEIKTELLRIKSEIHDLQRQMPDSPELQLVSHDDLESGLRNIESQLDDIESDIKRIESDVSSIQLKVGY